MSPGRRGHRATRRGIVLAAVALVAAGIPFQLPGTYAPAAEAGPPPVERYLVPLPEEDIRTGALALYGSTGDDIRTVISITGAVDGTFIYYDHWEDGFEVDLANPVQATSELWGDGDASNGAPPGCALDSCDTFGAGDNAALANTIPANPRIQANIFYDGGDQIGATGPVAVTRAGWPIDPGTLLAGAVEVYPTDAWGTQYEVPFGVDSGLGSNFQYTGASIMAAAGPTTVQIDADADAVFEQSVILAEGQSTLVSNLSEGAGIISNGPVQVDLLTGDVGATYEGRWFALLPTNQWATSYFNPVGTVVGDDPATAVLYNPGGSALTVTVNFQGGSTTVNVPAGSTATYTMPNSGAQFSAGSNFYATVLVDYDGTTHDWGFTLVPETRLSTAAVVGWGPGADGTPTPATNYSPVWVTSEGATTLYVDYDGDPTTGTLTDPNGDQYDTAVPLVAFESVRLRDPADGDQTGMKVYTLDGDRIAVAYGQDPQGAPGGTPALDLGTTVVPLLLVAMAKLGSLEGDTNGNGALDPGEFIRYTVTIRNDGTAILDPAQFTDDLDPNTTYVPNSTTIDGVPYSDDGVTPFPFDEGGQNLGPIVPGQVLIVTYDVQLNDPLPPDTDSIVNDAQLNSIGISIEGTSTLPVFEPFLEVTKSSDVPATGALPGDRITYTVVVDNTSDAPQDGFTVSDVVPTGTSYVPESTSVTGPVTTGGTYADDFQSGGYGGSTGSILWVPDWTDIGEGNNPNGGDVQIVNLGGSLRLRMQDNDNGASRAVDLSGYDSATMSFIYARNSFENDDDWVELQANDGQGSGWVPLQRWEGPATDPVFLPHAESLDAYLTATASIRFITSPDLSDFDQFYVDDVVITATNTNVETRTNQAVDPTPLVDGVAPNLVVPADPFTLDPGQSMTITFQVDVDDPLAGGITELTNTVFVNSAQQPTFATDSVTDPVAFPDVTLTKSLLSNADEDGSGDVSVNDTLTYQFVAVNSGDTALTDVTITDPLGGLSALSCTPAQPASLAIGESLTCTATYVVTQADVNTGQIDNTATVDALDPGGNPVNDTDDETVPINRIATITIVKSLQTPLAGIGVGDPLDYDFVVTNTGNVDLDTIVVTDPLVGGTVTCPQNTLAPAESMTCSASYTVTQTDVDAGQIANTATVDAEDPDDNPVTDTDDELAILEQNPSIDLAKSLQSNADEDGSGDVSLNDTLTYEFVVTNDGDVSLINVALDDPLTGGPVTCPQNTLAPAESMTCTATYIVTQADIDAGVINNTATVDAESTTGTDVSDSDDESVSTAQSPSISLTKSFIGNADEDGSGDVSEGDTLTYQFDIFNDGNVTLTNVTLTDPLPGLSPFNCAPDVLPATMAPGAVITCTATYVVTLADVTAGRIDNTATATGEQPDSTPISDDDSETVFPDRNPSITLTKTLLSNADEDGSGDVSFNDTLTYQFVATNDGDVTLDNVTITDPLAGLSPLTCVPVTGSSLAPAATMTCTATYVVTQADVDAGEINNTATATGDDSGGGGSVSDLDGNTVSVAQNPSIGLTKSLLSNADEDGSGDVSLNDTLTYQFVATNTGDVTLDNVTITDPLAGLSPLTCVPVAGSSLAPTATMTCSATYVVTQGDVDAGIITNTASVTGDDPDGNPVTDDDDETVTPPQNPSISLLKTLFANADEDGSGNVSAGDTLTYQFVATNDGDVTLSLVTITDPLAGLSPLTCVPVTGSSLAPGASMTCTAIYSVTQADVDNGSIDNTATVTSERPAGDPGDPGDDITDTDDHTVAIPPLPAILITKSLAGNADEDGSGDVTVGDTLSYEFLVENTGNVTLSSVGVTDPTVGAVTCPATVLAPGETTTCTATYVVTLADANAGSILNTATATGTDPNGTDVTDDDTVTTPVIQNPAISLTKTFIANADEDGSGGVSINDTLTYEFVATNTGDVTLVAVQITDPLAGLSVLTCVPPQPATLDPGDVITCTATYTVTQDDVDAAQIVNTATANGFAPDGSLVNDTDDEQVLIAQTASIVLNKTLVNNADEDGSGGITLNDTLTFQFIATNTGNVSLTGATITDPLPGLGPFSCLPAQPANLLPGDSLGCTADYVVTQADVDAAGFTNTATVTALDPDTNVVTDDDTVVTPIEGSPDITIDKSLAANADEDGSGDVSVGDTLTYQFIVENTGDVTLTNVTVTDPLPGMSAIVCAPAQGSTLAPTETLSCAATYTVTAADTAVGQIDNTATALGFAPAGTPTSDDDTETVLTGRADVSLVKTVSDPTPNVGDTVTFSISVTNGGPGLALNLEVTDVLPAGYTYVPASIGGGDTQDDTGAPTFVWTIASLASGASTPLTFQATVDAPTGAPNEYLNVAEVTASDAFDPDSTPDNDDGDQSEDDEDNASVTPEAADLSLTKIVSDATPEVGDTVTFTVTLSNGGPDTATNVVVTDVLPGGYTYVPVSISGGDANDDSGAPTLTWTVNTLASGGSEVLTFDATVDAPTGAVDEYLNVAEVTAADQFDPDSTPANDDGDQSEDDEANASVVPIEADLSLAKAVSNANPNVGDSVTFTVTLSNGGPDTATNVEVTDTLPVGFSYDVGSIAGGDTQDASGAPVLVWTVASLASGGSVDLTFTATVQAPTGAALEFVNVAEVTAADQFDPDSTPDNDDGDQSEDDEANTVSSPLEADVSITKFVSDATPEVGDSVTFTIAVVNSGPNPATNVTVTDVLPAGYTYDAASIAGGDAQDDSGAPTLTWMITNLAVGPSVNLTFSATVLGPTGAPNEYLNVAQVTMADQYDPDSTPGNDDGDQSEDDEDNESVTPIYADVSLTKGVSDGSPNVGDVVTFTVTVTNDGPDTVTNVEVTDVLPGGFTYTPASIAGGDSQDDTGAPTLVWTVTSLASGASVLLTFTATVEAPTGALGEHTNVAEVTAADQFDSDSTPGNDDGDQSEDDEDNSTVFPQESDLSLTKTVSDAAPNVGDTVTFTISVFNSGPDAATNVEVTDVLPGGFTYTAASIAGGDTQDDTGAPVLVWTDALLPTGASMLLTFDATVDAPTGALDEYLNVAEVSNADQYDPDSAPANDDGDQSEDDEDNASVTPQQADLSIVKTVSDPTPNVGDVVTFSISVANGGPDAATNVEVTDVLPAGYTYTAASIAGGDTQDDTGAPTFVWTIASLASGSSEPLTFTATVEAPTGALDEYLNVAEVTAVDQYDPDSAPANDDGDQSEDDEDNASVTPQQADVSIAKAVDDTTPNVGDSVTFTITVTNDGPDAATNVEVTDVLPAGYTYDAASIAGGDTQDDTGAPTLVWTITSLANGASVDLTFAATVEEPTGAPEEYLNVAEVTAADQLDPDSTPDNDDGDQSEDDEDNVSVTPQSADLSLAKAVDDASPLVGDTVTFTLTLTNGGPDTATNVEVTDTLPVGFTYTPLSISGGDAQDDSGAPILTWTVNSLASGASVDLTFTASVESPTGGPGEYTNVAEVTAADQDDPDSTPDNDDGDQSEDDEANTISSPLEADVSLVKTVSDPTPNVGDSVTFTIAVTNGGPDTATNLEITDVLPAGYTYDAASIAGGDTQDDTGAPTLVWTIASLASAASTNLTFTATVLGPTGAVNEYLNVAEVTAVDQFDPDSTPANDDGDQSEDDEDNASVVPIEADLSLAKAVSDSTPSVGDSVTFTITVSNAGPDTATNVEVTDTLPVGFTYTPLSISGGDTQDDTGAPTFVWTVASLASGASVDLTFTATVLAPTFAADEYLNVAEVTASDQFDPDSTPANDDGDQSEDDEASVAITTPEVADLSLAKAVSDSGPAVGDSVTFTITLSNAGPDAATNVEVTDVLPAGYTYDAASISGGDTQDDSGAPTLIWTVASLASGASVDLTFSATVLVPTGAVDEYFNAAEVTAADQFDPDSTPANDDGDQSEDDEAGVGLLPGSIGIAKAVQAVTNSGDGSFTVSYLLTVENFGGTPISNLAIYDDFATQFSTISPSGFVATDGSLTANPAWDGTAGSNVLAAGQTLAVGAIGSVQVTVTVVPGADLGPHDNTATVEGTTPSGTPVTDDSTDGTDPDADGDDADGTVDDDDVPDEDDPTPVSFDESPAIGLAKDVTSGPTSNGDGSFDVTYTLVVENLGDVDLSGLQVTDDLAVTFAAADAWSVVAVTSADFATSGTYDGDTDTDLLAGTETITVGSSGSLDLTVRVTPGADLGPYDNTATASGTSPAGTTVVDVSQDGVDPDPDGNDDATDNSDPTPVVFPGLGGVSGTVWADDDADGVIDGGESGYNAIPIDLVDPGPDGIVGTGDDVLVATTLTGPAGDYTFVDVPAGDYVVVVDTGALPAGVVPTFDIDGGDDSQAAVTIPPGEFVADVDFGYTDAFDVAIVKTVTGDPEPDAAMQFVLTITNNGPGTAVGPFTVTDAVPSVFEITGVSGAAGWTCTVTGQDVECTFAGDLADGEVDVIVIDVLVVGEPGDQATNSASVSVDGPVEDGDLTNNTDGVVVTIGELPITGAELGRIATLGFLLLAFGIGLAMAGRRRRLTA